MSFCKNRLNSIYIHLFAFSWISLLTLVSGSSCSSSSTVEQPNVLFILTDDQWASDAASLGNPLLETPNIDWLAEESMRFTNAFTSTAMCVPSRTSLYTGLHPMRHGAHPNHAPIRQGTETVATRMADLGYRVGLIGKTHVNPIDSFGFHYVKDLLDFAWDAKLTKEEIKTAMDSLGQGGNPFVLFVCISNPHTPWPGEWKGDPAKIQLQDYLYDEPKTRQTLARYFAHVEIADRKVGEALDAAREMNLLDEMVVFFSSDHGAEFVHSKYTVYDAGIRVPFLVRWPGVVEPGSECDAQIQFVDVVPTLVDIAGGEIEETGGVDMKDEMEDDLESRMVDGISILPLFADPQRELHSYVFATSSKDGNKTDYPIKAIRTRDYKYIVNPEYEETYTSWITDSSLGTNWPGYDRHYGYWLSWLDAARTDSTAAWMVSNYLHRPPEELYDLSSDPGELHNIASDPAMQEVKLELRTRLEAWMISQGDVHYSKAFFEKLDP